MVCQPRVLPPTPLALSYTPELTRDTPASSLPYIACVRARYLIALNVWRLARVCAPRVHPRIASHGLTRASRAHNVTIHALM